MSTKQCQNCGEFISGFKCLKCGHVCSTLNPKAIPWSPPVAKAPPLDCQMYCMAPYSPDTHGHANKDTKVVIKLLLWVHKRLKLFVEERHAYLVVQFMAQVLAEAV